MLGITIGIRAVICTVTIGEGGSHQIREQMLMLGDNFVWVEAGGRDVNGVRTGTGATKTLSLADMRAILQTIPLIKSYSPQVDARIQVVYGNQNWNATYRGVSPEYLDIRRWSVAEGMSFSQDEVAASANVCLAGTTIAAYLFEKDDPVGKTIRVRDMPFKVIGALEPKGQSAIRTTLSRFLTRRPSTR